MSKPYACPVCYGTGIVSRPPWIAGDQQFYSMSILTTYSCNACNGVGILWSKDSCKDCDCEKCVMGRGRDKVIDDMIKEVGE